MMVTMAVATTPRHHITEVVTLMAGIRTTEVVMLTEIMTGVIIVVGMTGVTTALADTHTVGNIMDHVAVADMDTVDKMNEIGRAHV